MTKPRLSLALALILLASACLAALAPTAAAHTCYGQDCGDCASYDNEYHHHHWDADSWCTYEPGPGPHCDVHVRPVCIIIECLATDFVSLGIAAPRLAAYQGVLGSGCAG